MPRRGRRSSACPRPHTRIRGSLPSVPARKRPRRRPGASHRLAHGVGVSSRYIGPRRRHDRESAARQGVRRRGRKSSIPAPLRPAARRWRDRAPAPRRPALTSHRHSSTADERRSVFVPGLYVRPRRRPRGPASRSTSPRTLSRSHWPCIVVALEHAAEQRAWQPPLPRQLVEEPHIASECAAGERRAPGER